MKNTCIENKKVYHDYFVDDTLECGVVITGNEIKSIRAGKVSIKEAWVDIVGNEMFIKQMNVTKWDTANMFDIDETRMRKLLAHKSEIRNYASMIKLDGYTLMPCKIYIDNSGKCKILVGLCKGKHDWDKRQCEREKQAKMDMARYK